MKRIGGWLLLAAGLAVPAPSSADDPEAARRFAALVDREWAWRLAEFPTLATAVGVHDYDDRLEDASLAAYERRDAETAAFVAELEAIDRSALAEGDRVDYAAETAAATAAEAAAVTAAESATIAAAEIAAAAEGIKTAVFTKSVALVPAPTLPSIVTHNLKRTFVFSPPVVRPRDARAERAGTVRTAEIGALPRESGAIHSLSPSLLRTI